MLVRNKHSNLLRTFINYRRKMFYQIGLWKACEEQTLQLIANFHKLLKKKVFIRLVLGKLERNKHTSLLRAFINYRRKSFKRFASERWWAYDVTLRVCTLSFISFDNRFNKEGLKFHKLLKIILRSLSWRLCLSSKKWSWKDLILVVIAHPHPK